jgi:hypothetical protein
MKWEMGMKWKIMKWEMRMKWAIVGRTIMMESKREVRLRGKMWWEVIHGNYYYRREVILMHGRVHIRHRVKTVGKVMGKALRESS